MTRTASRCPRNSAGAFAEGVILTAGLDGCLYAYPRSEWEVLAERIRSSRPARRGRPRVMRLFFAAARRVSSTARAAW